MERSRSSLFPAGRYAQSRYLIIDRSQYGLRVGEHIGDIVAAGLEFGNGPCFELYHSMSDDPVQDDVSFCSSLKGTQQDGRDRTSRRNERAGQCRVGNARVSLCIWRWAAVSAKPLLGELGSDS